MTEDAAMKAARQVGLDIARLERDMAADQVERHIYMLAEHMGLVGTPMFIVLDELRRLVRRARETLA